MKLKKICVDELLKQQLLLCATQSLFTCDTQQNDSNSIGNGSSPTSNQKVHLIASVNK